jgi:hypothetical protein
MVDALGAADDGGRPQLDPYTLGAATRARARREEFLVCPPRKKSGKEWIARPWQSL